MSQDFSLCWISPIARSPPHLRAFGSQPESGNGAFDWPSLGASPRTQVLPPEGSGSHSK